MRPEDGPTAAVVGCRPRALAGPAGPLLAIGLATAAADLAPGLGVVGPDAAAGELGGHDLVEDGSVHGRGKQHVTELDAADRGAGPVVEGRLGHRVRPSSRG